MTNGQIHISIELIENGNVACLTILQDGRPLAHAKFEAPEFDEFLSTLGKCRAQMPDIVPMDLEPSGRMAAINDPVWRTTMPKSAQPHGVMLALRHPGFGWLGNFLPSHEAEAMGKSLTDLAAQPSPEETGPS